MAAKASTQREMQDQSIKARKHELFVEEAPVEAAPRKQFREYLRQTPAAPLSKNVKMMLWGSAAPVAFLFVAALLTSKGSSAKPPEELLIPVNRAPISSAPAPVDHQPKPHKPKRAPEPAVVAHGTTPETKATNSEPTEEKPKVAAKKKKGRGKGKNKKNQPKVEIVKTDETPKAEEPAKAEVAKTDESAKGEKTPDAKSKDSAKAPEPAPRPEKPKVSVFKKKKPPVFTYPKGKSEDEKKNVPNP